MEEEFEKFPLANLILHPSKHEDDFNLTEHTAEDRQNLNLNPSPEDAIVQKLCNTLKEISKPKVTLLQGPSGKFFFIMCLDFEKKLLSSWSFIF